jgi:uncharacterized protein (TIGR02271 family)
VSGAATGAAIGAIGGPVGMAIGALAGALTGGLIGNEIGEASEAADEEYWKNSYKDRKYYNQEHDYDRDVAPAYRYGANFAGRFNPGSTYTNDVRQAQQQHASAYDAIAHADDDNASETRAGAASGASTGDTSMAFNSSSENQDQGTSQSISSNAKSIGNGIDDGKPGTVVSRALGLTDANDESSSNARGFDAYDDDLRAGWDDVRGDSKLSYDEARDAIRDAYERTIQLRRERLNVEKEQVQRGEAHIRKEVITEHQTIEVPVQREELVIERRQVNEVAPGGLTDDPTQRDIRIPLKEERVNVSKETVVEEEVSVGVRTVTDTKKIEADIQHEELRTSDISSSGSSTSSSSSSSKKR